MPPPLLLPGEVDDDDDEDQDDFEDGLESDGDFHADMDYDHPWVRPSAAGDNMQSIPFRDRSMRPNHQSSA